MAERKNLVSLGSGGDPDATHSRDLEVGATDAWNEEPEYLLEGEETWEEQPGRDALKIVVPALAVTAVLGWSGFFAWVHQADIRAGTPQVWSDLIVSWAVPVLLVIALWLLAMRNSTREAARFGDAARSLSAEAAHLETRLAVVNRELSLARDFIASQSRDLESLGRIAGERLSTHADRLQGLIRDNGEQVQAIGHVSETALGNMNRLRDHLPVIANAARDVASQIGNAGHTAQGQIEDMVAGFDRLNQFGEAGVQHVEKLRFKVSETLDGLGQQVADLDRYTHERFERLRGQNEEFRVALEERETDVLAAIRRRADELSRELEARAEEARRHEEQAIDAMRARLLHLREEGGRLTSDLREGQEEARGLWGEAIEQLETRMREAIGQISHVDASAMESARRRLAQLSEEIARADVALEDRRAAFESEYTSRHERVRVLEEEAISHIETRVGAFDERMNEREQHHLAHVASLADRAQALALRLGELDGEMARLATEGREEGVKLAEATDMLAASLSQSRVILDENKSFVASLTDDSVRLLEIVRSTADHSAGALSDSIGEAERRLMQFETHAEALRSTIGDAEAKGAELAAHLDRASATGGASIETLAEMEARIARVAAHTESLANRARGELQGAIGALEDAAARMVDKLRTDQAEVVREIAERIGTEGSQAIARALGDGASEAIADLEQAAIEAGERGRDTARQLRDQLAMVNELAGNLETRVAHARARAEEQVDSDFSRRMALITQSLNSTSIDISKAFNNEVTDTAWASYLRGDRGIFTRRAVRLLDNQEARAVAEIYQSDGEFRETVNRYIHDFEAMLRQVLSTRDGNALAVTLLSSDIGKLYVALAQAIERLRG